VTAVRGRMGCGSGNGLLSVATRRVCTSDLVNREKVCNIAVGASDRDG
jgi:hypothetical protein